MIGSNHQQRSKQTMSTVAFKPWPTSVVESNGDYRNESWIEEHVGVKAPGNPTTITRFPAVYDAILTN